MHTFYEREMLDRVRACQRAAQTTTSDDLKRLFRRREDELLASLRPWAKEVAKERRSTRNQNRPASFY
jgi:hypothetical protein